MKKSVIRAAVVLFCSLFLVSCAYHDALPKAAEDAAAAFAAAEETEKWEEKGETETTKAPVRAPVYPPLEQAQLEVENILQLPHLPNGCEVVSLAIVLQYHFNIDMDPVWLSDNYLPKGPFDQVNPESTYVGDPKGEGFGCYVPCLQVTAGLYMHEAGYLDYAANNLTGSSMEELEAWVAGGTPVILWATVDMEPSVVAREWKVDGYTVRWFSGSHCVVLSGYTEDKSIICDPLKGVVEYDRQDVIDAYELVGRRAMVLYQP